MLQLLAFTAFFVPRAFACPPGCLPCLCAELMNHYDFHWASANAGEPCPWLRKNQLQNQLPVLLGCLQR
jgi:hypothetical protein